MSDTLATERIRRLALRPKEAAAALGVGERTLRQILPEIPHLRVGGSVLIPVNMLRQWLEERAIQQAGQVDAAVKEILDSVNSD